MRTDITPSTSTFVAADQPSPGTPHSARGVRLCARACARRSTRPGFTFIEVLFSIVILGVGMIMIAGMLPVAIKQTADARNDLTSKTVCDSGYAYLRTLAQTHPEAFPETHGMNTVDGTTVNSGNSIYFPTSGTSSFKKFMTKGLMTTLDNNDQYSAQGSGSAFPFDPPGPTLPSDRRAGRVIPLSFDVVRPDNSFDIATLMDNHNVNNSAMPPAIPRTPESDTYPLAFHQLILGDRIVTSDPRFQWLGFYRRDEGSSVAKVIVVGMRKQSTEGTDRFAANTTIAQEEIDARNGPFLVPVEIEDSLTEADKVKFVGTPGTDAYDVDVAEPGSYLIIAHSPPLSGSPVSGDLNRPFRNNGRIFRLGTRREDLDGKVTGGGRVWDLAPGYDLPSTNAGPDGILGTADDLPDGSMNTTQSFDENAGRAAAVSQYRVENDSSPVDVKGTVAWAWLIGKGRIDAGSASASQYVGATQDLGVLTVDLPLK